MASRCRHPELTSLLGVAAAAETRGVVITMSVGDIATMVTIVGGVVAIVRTTLSSNRNLKNELKQDIEEVRTSLGESIRQGDVALGERIDRVETSLGARIETLDERMYALTLYVAPHLAAVGAPGIVVPPAGATKPPAPRRRIASRPTPPTPD